MTQNISATTVTRAFLNTLANLIAILVASVCFIFAAACWQMCPAHGGTLAHEISQHWNCGCTQRQIEKLPAPSVNQTVIREQWLSASDKSISESKTWKLLFAIPRNVKVVDSGDVIHTHTVDDDGIMRCRRVATYADAKLDKALKPLNMICEADTIIVNDVAMEKERISKESLQTAANLNAGGSYDAVIFLPYYSYCDLHSYSEIYGVCHYTYKENGTYAPVLAVLCGNHDIVDIGSRIDWIALNTGVFAHEFGHAMRWWASGGLGLFDCIPIHWSYSVPFLHETDWCWDWLVGDCLKPVIDGTEASADNRFHWDQKRTGLNLEVWQHPFRLYQGYHTPLWAQNHGKLLDQLIEQHGVYKATEMINAIVVQSVNENYPRRFFQQQQYTAGFSRTVVPTLEIKTSQDIWLLGETYSDHNPANFWRDVVSLYQVAAIPEEIMVIDNETEERIYQLEKGGSYRVGLKSEAYTVRVSTIKDLTYLSAEVYKLVSEDNGSRMDFATICPWLTNVSGDLYLNDEAGNKLSNGQEIDEGVSLSAWKATDKVGVGTANDGNSNGGGKGCNTGSSSLLLLVVLTFGIKTRSSR